LITGNDLSRKLDIIFFRDFVNFDNISEENGNFEKIKKLPKGPTIFLPKSWTVDLDLAWSAGFYYAEVFQF